MSDRTAKAGVLPVRQRTQYSCMAASMMMCLKALSWRCLVARSGELKTYWRGLSLRDAEPMVTSLP